jgi:hypothetical protein
MSVFGSSRKVPDITGDANVMRTANVLNRVILIITILTALGLIATPLLFERKMGSAIIILALLMMVIVAKLLMQRGQVRLAGICAVSGVWLIFAFLNFMGGGLDNINFFAICLPDTF